MKQKHSNFWRRAKDVLLAPVNKNKVNNLKHSKSLRYEPLEPRIALSAQAIVDFVATPAGQLDGKIVFTSGGAWLAMEQRS